MSPIYASESKAVEATARHELRRSPVLWGWESARLMLYVGCRVLFVPWCLVWPALTVWLVWWWQGVDARTAIELFADGPDRAYAWIYVVGATIHGLAIIGSDPYEWEIDRRVNAKVLAWANRKRRAGITIAPAS